MDEIFPKLSNKGFKSEKNSIIIPEMKSSQIKRIKNMYNINSTIGKQVNLSYIFSFPHELKENYII